MVPPLTQIAVPVVLLKTIRVEVVRLHQMMHWFCFVFHEQNSQVDVDPKFRGFYNPDAISGALRLTQLYRLFLCFGAQSLESLEKSTQPEYEAEITRHDIVASGGRNRAAITAGRFAVQVSATT